jgi:predicted PurR-regulated permease PerM
MVGALMAVPLVVILKILADHVPGLEWLSIVLERGERGPAEQTTPSDVPG